MSGIVAVQIPGYAPGLAGGVPATSDTGGLAQPEVQVFRIPPVVWMLVFLVVGYIGVRMLLED